MFKTIKSKIILITVSLLLIFSFILSLFIYAYMRSSENLVIRSCYYNIAVFAQNISKQIIKIEENAKELALIGHFSNRFHFNKNNLEAGMMKIFSSYPNTLGGGVWYEPYAFNPNQKRYCLYIYRTLENQLVPDSDFEGEAYNYLNQNWYKEIKSELKKENEVVWSTPYYENEGSKTLMVTAGAGIYEGDKLIGLATADWRISNIVDNIRKMKPTPHSFALFADEENDYIIVTTDPYLNGVALLGKSLKYIPWYNPKLQDVTYMTYENTVYVPYVKHLDNGMLFIVCVPKNELFYFVFIHAVILFSFLMFIFLIITILLYIILKNNVEKPISKLINIANKISSGEINEHFKIQKPEEFSKLAATFEKMTNNIKTITKDKEKMESELTIAKDIQSSSLPNIFPPYPDRKDFEIFASMAAAKEVGGDFYDFYFIDENNFMFLIADVSGKGVPAALFMMTVKTLIANLVQVGKSPEDMVKEINKKTCENNKQGFFVTMLIGLVNLKTGKLTLVNCGHNLPLIQKSNGNFDYLKIKPNIVLGFFENADFEAYETYLNKNDTIFLYTDGITEAMNENENLYGEKRLSEILDASQNKDIDTIVKDVKADVLKFANGTPQSDDMTMLIFRYKGGNNLKIFQYIEKAELSLYSKFLEWLNDFFKKENISDKIKEKTEFIAEEIYTNIASYAYTDTIGDIEVYVKKLQYEQKEISEEKVEIIFKDNGKQYNPLEKADPDINAPLEDREIGGLGIFMIKQIAESFEYEYKDGYNISKIIIK